MDKYELWYQNMGEFWYVTLSYEKHPIAPWQKAGGIFVLEFTAGSYEEAKRICDKYVELYLKCR